MVWNTIAHPKMMLNSNPGGSSSSPIKFADTHKLSFYDIIVTTANDEQPILAKGDFETIKKMLLNDEVICGAFFTSLHGNDVNLQEKQEFVRFIHEIVLDYITLYPVVGDPLYLLSDNTISTTEPASLDPGSGSKE